MSPKVAATDQEVIEARLRVARAAVDQAEQDLASARSYLQDEIADAVKAGLSLGWIATLTGYSKPYIALVRDAVAIRRGPS